MIHHLICISWLNSDHSTAEYLNSFNSNNNFSKYFICIDCHESEIIYHQRDHCNFLQSYVLALISRSETHLFSRNVKEDNITNIMLTRSARMSKSIKIRRKTMQRMRDLTRSESTSKSIEINLILLSKTHIIDSENKNNFKIMITSS